MPLNEETSQQYELPLVTKQIEVIPEVDDV